MDTKLVLLCCLAWGVGLGHCLSCYCRYPEGIIGDCDANNTCGGPRVEFCYFQRQLMTDLESGGDKELQLWTCLISTGGLPVCSSFNERIRRTCCDTDFCNEDLELEPFPGVSTSPPPPPPTPPSVTSNTTDTTGGGAEQSDVYRRVTILVPVCSAILIIIIILATPTLLYLFRKRKQRIESIRAESHQRNGREPSPVCTPYSLETLDLDDQTCTSGSGSGVPLLTQRTIARCIIVGETIGSGRFGQVHVGEYMGDKVAVKKFATRDEKSWFRETEIYNTVLLRHDNILGYMASDIYSLDGVTELWLVTQFHPHGSLFDYLNRETISPRIMMKMAITTCKGLTHLHTEVVGTSAKPSMAHRDMKSKNILVKNNLECCIADFGLAVMNGPSSIVNFPSNPKQGTKRYMAPEILSETISMNKIEGFQKADIYAFGLVLWEMCTRCVHKNDSVGDYEPPFHGKVGPDPTFEEMRKVVVVDRQQPTIPAHWHSDDLLQSMTDVLKECWYFNPNARNNALFYKLKLMELAREDKIEYDVQE